MFECKIDKNVNGFNIKVFELDTQHSDALRNTIKSKIKRMKVYNEASHVDLLPPNISDEFKEQFRQKTLEITRPKDHKLKWFDVKRAYATEFMSQLLLEKEYNCIFHEESDKKINVDPVDIDKPIPGIDIVGLQEHENDFKFVICEVKASEDIRIPCSSASDLLDDIEKAIDDDKRISKEILQYVRGLAGIDNDSITKSIDFLTNLLLLESSKSAMFEKIIFFPFMIRSNENIVANQNLDDFSMFKTDKLKDIDLCGVIWSLNENINDFCINMYNEALEELTDVN